MNNITNHNSINDEPVIGITMGDPAGIGPEVVVKALADPAIRRSAKFIIFGMDEQLRYAADKAEIEPFWGRHQHEKISRNYPHKVMVADYDEFSVPPWVREPTQAAGEASVKFCVLTFGWQRWHFINRFSLIAIPVAGSSTLDIL